MAGGEDTSLQELLREHEAVSPVGNTALTDGEGLALSSGGWGVTIALIHTHVSAPACHTLSKLRPEKVTYKNENFFLPCFFYTINSNINDTHL